MAQHFISQNTLITILTILLLSSSQTSAKNPPLFTTIYAFGDSFTDTGNWRSSTGPQVFQHVSNPPYGTTFNSGHKPTNRYSDGRLVIDFITESLKLPFLPPYHDSKSTFSNGVNFAVAGSTAINHDFFVRNNLTLAITPESIQTQLSWFDNVLEKQGCGSGVTRSRKACDQVFGDSLIWVGEIGVNDYAYTLGSAVTSSTIRDLAVKSVAGFLEAILEKGAKYVIVQGLPPTGCLPFALALAPADDRDGIGCVGSVNKYIYTHNTLLQAKLHDLRLKFPHSIISYADYFNAYSTVMENPKTYGFIEPFKACCGAGGGPYNFEVFEVCGSPNVNSSCSNPYKYVNWDGVHLTEGMYKVVSDMFLHGKFCHPPFDYLLGKKQESV